MDVMYSVDEIIYYRRAEENSCGCGREVYALQGKVKVCGMGATIAEKNTARREDEGG